MRIDTSGLQEDLGALRRALHREPELGLQLPRTQEKILSALEGLPLEITLGQSLTSVTAVLRGGQPGPVVLLRADMDALPLREATGSTFAAPGPVMHACGHDLHTAMLVGAAHELSSSRHELAGDVVLAFQPGEEGFDGARHMIAEGLLDLAGNRPDAAYALHVTSGLLPLGMFACRDGAILAAAAQLNVTVRGAGGHGSMPHRAVDPVPATCEMVLALQTMATRRFDVFDPVVVTVGSLHAGTAHNVIPDEATFQATLRSFSDHAHERLIAECERLVHGIANAHGLSVEVSLGEVFPPTVNHASNALGVESLVRERFGDDRYTRLARPMAGSEDFSRVLQEVPGALVLLGATPPGRDARSAPVNHSPLAEFDEHVLSDGVALLVDLALTHVGHEQASGPGSQSAL